MHRLAVAGAALALGVLAGCSSSEPGSGTASSPAATSTPPTTSAIHSTPPSSRPPSTSTTPSSSAPPFLPPAERVFSAMTLRQRVGQLLMVDCPTSGATGETQQAITQYHVGSVILDGTSYAGRDEIAVVTRNVQALAPRGDQLLVATDQEGGQVQRLQGQGFDRIPAATVQGTIAPTTLQRQTKSWATQLRRAGVTVDLAPVLDVVPADFGANPPVGDLDREYGNTPAAVTSHGVAVVRGLASAGVAATVKHFPGLGRVHGNTDLTGGVTDTMTTTDDPFLAPFRAAIASGVPFVMISTADYARIDPGVPAAFSFRIVTGLLRDQLGFDGVIVSDDVGHAAQVADYSVGERAVRFVAAGGDLLLTVDAGQAGEMTSALVSRAKSDPAFRRLVNAAALRVLRAKEQLGLLR
jgi:beta-N-acetylhexosaminidase